MTLITLVTTMKRT